MQITIDLPDALLHQAEVLAARKEAGSCRPCCRLRGTELVGRCRSAPTQRSATMTLARAGTRYGLDARAESASVTSVTADVLPQDPAESLALTADPMETSVEALTQEAIRQSLAAQREQIEHEIAAYETTHSRLWQEMLGMQVMKEMA